MDYAALKAEITTDPAQLGYAAMVASGSDQGIADLLNTPGPTITVSSLDRDGFLLATMPATLALASASATLQGKWDRLLGVACAASSVSIGAWSVLGPMAVTDGLLTQAQADAVFTRKGTRAESLWGAGASVSNSDVSFALRGNR